MDNIIITIISVFFGAIVLFALVKNYVDKFYYLPRYYKEEQRSKERVKKAKEEKLKVFKFITEKYKISKYPLDDSRLNAIYKYIDYNDEEKMKEFLLKQSYSSIYDEDKKDNLEQFKKQINLFINEMKKMPDWYQIIQARGNGHEMAKSMGIKVDDYEYWANAHKEEYMLKYNDGNLDVDGIKLRIEKFGFIVAELEKVIKKAAEMPRRLTGELKLNITHEMHNDYCAARASVLGAEYALKEIIIKKPVVKKPSVKTVKKETPAADISIEKGEGEAKGYYKSGELLSTGNFVDGLTQGETKFYYKSGELQLTVNYVDGLRQGEAKLYYKSGELQATINYVDDVKQ